MAALARQRRVDRAPVERAVGVKKLTVRELGRLELAYNSCIDMLMRFFTRRIELVQVASRPRRGR